MADQPGVPGGDALPPQLPPQPAPTPQVRPQGPTMKVYGSGASKATTPGITNTFQGDFSRQNKEIDQALKGFKDISSDIGNITKALKDVLGDMHTGAKSLDRDFRDVKGTLRDLVDSFDDAEDAMKNIGKLKSQMASVSFFDKKDKAASLKFINDVVKGLKQASKNTEHMVDLKPVSKQLKDAADKAEALREEIEKAGGSFEDMADEAEHAFRQIASSIDKTTDKVKIQWTRSLSSVRKEMRDTTKEVLADFKKFDKNGNFSSILRAGKMLAGGAQLAGAGVQHKAGAKASQIRADRYDRSTRGLSAAQTASKLASGGATVMRYAGVFGDRKSDPLFRRSVAKTPRSEPSVPSDESQDKFTSAPWGKWKQHWAQKARDEYKTGGPSALTRLAFQGGGSLLKGMGGAVAEGGLGMLSKAGGMVGEAGGVLGGLGGGMAGMAMKAAPVLAIGKALMDVWDKTAEVNKRIEDSTAKGGLVSGGVTKGYGGVRSMLGSTGDQVALGLTWEKNADLMKQMVESGLTLNETTLTAATADSDYLRHQIDSFKETGTGSSMGAAWLASTRMSRPIGLSDKEGMDLNIKLQQQYHQSASESIDFFDKVSKATKASGISTTKYIAIVEGLASKFENLGNSLNHVEFMFNQLGKSGRYTAEQLKDMVDYFSKGKEMPLENKAFIFQQAGKDLTDKMADAQKSEADYAANLFKEQINGNPKAAEAFKGMTLGPGMDYQEAALRLNNPGIDQNDRKMLSGILERYRSGTDKSQILQQGGVNAAIGLDAYGEDFNSSATEMLSGLKVFSEAFGADFKDLTSNIGKYLSNPTAAMGLKTMGFDPTKLVRDLPKTMLAAGEAVNKAIPSDDSDPNKVKMMNSLVEALLRNGKGSTYGFNGDAKHDRLQLRNFKDSHQLTKDLSDLPESLLELISLDSDVKKNLEDANTARTAQEMEVKTRGMEAETKTSADVFSRSFEWLFFEIIKPLSTIRDIIVDWFGDENNAEKDKSQKGFDSLMAGGFKEKTLKLMDAKEKEWEDQRLKLAGKTDPEDVAKRTKLEEDLKQLHIDRDKLNSANRDNFVTGKSVSDLSALGPRYGGTNGRFFSNSQGDLIPISQKDVPSVIQSQASDQPINGQYHSREEKQAAANEAAQAILAIEDGKKQAEAIHKLLANDDRLDFSPDMHSTPGGNPYDKLDPFGSTSRVAPILNALQDKGVISWNKGEGLSRDTVIYNKYFNAQAVTSVQGTNPTSDSGEQKEVPNKVKP